MVRLGKCTSFRHDSVNEFDGIITYFNSIYSKSTFDQVVLADSSSILDGRTPPNAVIDIKNINKNYTDWITESIENSNFTVQFRKHKIKLESYSLLGRLYNHQHPYHWILEATNNYVEWAKIHEYDNSDKPLANHTLIHIDNLTSENFYSIFRITQIGTNLNIRFDEYKYCLSFRAIDFYGKVCEESFEPKTCKQTLTVHYNFILITLICILA